MNSDTFPVSSKAWVKAYFDKIYAWALYKTSSKESAEDLVQDTFIAAFQSFAKFEEKSNSKPSFLVFSITKLPIIYGKLI